MAPLPPCDVLIHAGDATNTGEMGQLQEILDFMEAHCARFKILIAGNHEVTLDAAFYDSSEYWQRHHRGRYSSADCRALVASRPGVIYLEDSAAVLDFGACGSLTVYGSPWTPRFYEWGFNVDRGEAASDKWSLIPGGGLVDILVTHGPPHGILDKVGEDDGGFRLTGCESLLTQLGRVQPRLHCFGHIHEGYGVYRNPDSGIVFANASSCTENYRCTNKPIVCHVPFDKTQGVTCLSHVLSSTPNPT